MKFINIEKTDYILEFSMNSIQNLLIHVYGIKLSTCCISFPFKRPLIVNNCKGERVPGRPKKMKRGRPKTVQSTRQEQVRNAKTRYTNDTMNLLDQSTISNYYRVRQYCS